jgi:threonine dehydrogenase-like Zn-dependent dehydrogenase
MKAVLVRTGEAGSARLAERERPEPAADEVLVRVLEVGIDGTDREINGAVYGKPPSGEEWLTIGHEALGSVEAVGRDVEGVRVGDLVVPTVRRPCPERCLQCRMGQCDFCSTGHYTERGISGAHGYLAEYFTERPEYLIRLPAEHRRLAILLEPLSIVVKGVEQIFRIQQRLPWQPRRALVLGAGPIGLLATYVLRLRGLEVTTAARTPPPTPQAELAEASGARYVSTNQSPITTLDERLGDLDLIFEATGSSLVAFRALGILGINGVLCLTGVSAGDRELGIPADRLNLELVLGNKLVFGTVSSNPAHFAAAVRCIEECEARWPGLLGRLITRRLDLEGFAAALEDEPGIKTVLEIAE